jgi:hypothetical protein
MHQRVEDLKVPALSGAAVRGLAGAIEVAVVEIVRAVLIIPFRITSK